MLVQDAIYVNIPDNNARFSQAADEENTQKSDDDTDEESGLGMGDDREGER